MAGSGGKPIENLIVNNEIMHREIDQRARSAPNASSSTFQRVECPSAALATNKCYARPPPKILTAALQVGNFIDSIAHSGAKCKSYSSMRFNYECERTV